MPPPPPPYVAPDLRVTNASADPATLNIVVRPSGRISTAVIEEPLWLESHGAPLEVRMHVRRDESVRAFQVFYPNGEVPTDGLLDGNAYRVVSPPLGRSSLAGGNWTSLRNFIRIDIREVGGPIVATSYRDFCADGSLGRMDEPGTPAEPTMLPADCPLYDRLAIGRTVGVDRGWMQALELDLPRSSVRNLNQSADYEMVVTVNPRQSIAESNSINNSVTVPLKVERVPQIGAIEEPNDPLIGGLNVTDSALLPLQPLPHGAIPFSRRAMHVTAPPYAPDARNLPELLRYARSNTVLPRPHPRVQIRHDGTSHAHSAPQGMGFSKPIARLGSPTPPGVDLPDLHSLPATDINAFSQRGRDYLAFNALTWNAGPGKLEVEAFGDGSGGPMTAYQVFYDGTNRATRQQRGVVVWHEAHKHFHFNSFAQYDLVPADSDVMLRRSGKNSWCIAMTNLVDSTRAGFSTSLAWFASPLSACGTERTARWARLMMDVGGGDQYSQSIAGQAIDITGLPNGIYRIKITANPEDRIGEASYSNNVSYRRVRIGGTPGVERSARGLNAKHLDSPSPYVRG